MTRGVWRGLVLAFALGTIGTHARAADPIQLVGSLPLAIPAVDGFVTDVWGWVHPTTQREYAIVGTRPRGIHIVDVTDPTNPILVKYIDTTPGFDMVTWNQYLYTVDGGGGQSGQIFNLTYPANPVKVGDLPTAHSVTVSSGGMLWLNAPGLRALNLNTSATAPTIWYANGNGGHDMTCRGNIIYDYSGWSSGCRIFRYTPANNSIALLGTILNAGINYYHSGDRSADASHLYVLDEISFHPTPDITVWNIQDPAAPVMVNMLSDSTATAHNLLVKDDVAYVSYYTAGFKAFNIADPANPSLIGAYDTAPQTGECYCAGAYGVYPYGPSDIVYVSDWNSGLLLFRLNTTTTVRFTDVNAAAGRDGVTLSWRVWADEDIAGFRVYRQSGLDARDVLLTAAPLATGTRAFRDTSVQPGARYHYLVTALTADGDEERSAPVSVLVPEMEPGIVSVYPNPFRPRTTIAFQVDEPGPVRVDVFDARGARVRTLMDASVPAGAHSAAWDATDADGHAVASGVYFVRMTTGKHAFTHRMVLLK